MYGTAPLSHGLAFPRTANGSGPGTKQGHSIRSGIYEKTDPEPEKGPLSLAGADGNSVGARFIRSVGCVGFAASGKRTGAHANTLSTLSDRDPGDSCRDPSGRNAGQNQEKAVGQMIGHIRPATTFFCSTVKRPGIAAHRISTASLICRLQVNVESRPDSV